MYAATFLCVGPEQARNMFESRIFEVVNEPR